MTGIIKRVLLAKGFAFVGGDDGAEYFLHANELQGAQWEGVTVHEGARLEFTPVRTDRGLRASQARVIGPEIRHELSDKEVAALNALLNPNQ